MTAWNLYPENYRSPEIQTIVSSVCAGDCVAVIGLSGSGKSNLIGFLAHRVTPPPGCPVWVLVDCNRQITPGISGFMMLMIRLLDPEWSSATPISGSDEVLFDWIGRIIAERIAQGSGICLLLDRFDALLSDAAFPAIANGLRSLRDRYKYRLTLVIASRRPLPADNELAELFYDHLIRLGPLQPDDAAWSARRDADRLSATPSGARRVWDDAVIEKLAAFSGGYPSLLRAACQAYADGAELDRDALRVHPAVQMRIEEFWLDSPDREFLQLSGISRVSWLMDGIEGRPSNELEGDARLTAKEALLLEYFRAHPETVCEKDDLIRAVWPEDVLFTRGVRDESLAQLVRRLRVKTENNPDRPIHIQTVPGRGYIFRA